MVDDAICTMHIAAMETETVANVVGAFALGLVDDLLTLPAKEDRSQTAAVALVHLGKYEDMSIEALREPLGITHSACVRLVDKLEDEREVTRKPGEGRAVALRLTAKGARAAAALSAERQAALVRALAVLSNEEQATLGALVSKVLVSLVRDEPHAARICRLCDYATCPDATCPVGHALEHRSLSPSE